MLLWRAVTIKRTRVVVPYVCLLIPNNSIVVVNAQAIDQAAAAQVKAKWQENELAMSVLAGEVIQNLLIYNRAPQFHKLILDTINQRDELKQYTQQQLKKLVNNELPSNAQQLINDTLQYVAEQALAYKKSTEDKIRNGQLRSTTIIEAQLQLLQTNSLALMELKQSITNAAAVYTINSIVRQLTAVLAHGWATQRMHYEWRFQCFLRFKQPPKPTRTPATPQKAPTKPKPKSNPRTAKPQKKLGIKKENDGKLPMWDRVQEDRHIGSRWGKITGTDIDTKKGNCNNFQVWSTCVPQSTQGCDYKHVCNRCGSQTHGAHKCKHQ